MKALTIFVTLVAAMMFSVFTATAEERVLLPVDVDIQGAFGSRFATALAIHNFGESDVVIRGVDVFCPLSGCIDPDPNESGIPAGGTVDDFSPSGSPGRILLVPDDAGLEFSLRARDYSRDLLSAGVDIPVVPEAGFISRPFSLLNVFSGLSQFRSHLRVYGLAETTVRLRFVRQSSGEVLHEQVVELSAPATEFDPAFYELTQLPPSGLTPYRVELTSLTDNQPIWAFVSMTNNITQEITLATPYLGLSIPSAEPVIFETVWKDRKSNIRERRGEMVSSLERWNEVWPEIFASRPAPPPPSVNFEHDQILYFAAGENPDTCWRVEIEKVNLEHGIYRVFARDIRPPYSCTCTPDINYSIHVVKVPNKAESASFVFRQEIAGAECN